MVDREEKFGKRVTISAKATKLEAVSLESEWLTYDEEDIEEC
jgi:hypothetical protein